MAKISIPDPRSPRGLRGATTHAPQPEPGARKALEEPPAPRPPWRIAGMLFVIVVVVLVVRGFRSERVAPPPEVATSSTTTAEAPATAAPPLPPRCVDDGKLGFVIGELPKPKPTEPGAADDVQVDDSAPFAVEVGKGATFDGGFAVGALRDAEGGTVAMLATVGVDGTGGKLVRLARARGDLDPPVVTGAGPSVLAAFLEPTPSGRTVKVAKVTGEEVTWGPTFQEGKDESTALDVAASAGRAVVAWDDTTPEGKSAVYVASIDVASLAVTAPARAVSRARSESDTPRVIARPGGFWLAWLTRESPQDDDGAKGKKAKKPPKPFDDENSDETDTNTPAGEAIDHRWIEVTPLDEAGAPSGAPRAATAKDGSILAFDLKLGADAGALLVFRDDDTPTGSGGGRVGAALVKADGVVEPHPYRDDAAGAGAPTLQLGDGGAGGWLAMTGLSGRAYLGAVSARGELLEPLEIEPALANGEVLTGRGGVLLVAKPNGRAVRLAPTTCTPRAAARDGGP